MICIDPGVKACGFAVFRDGVLRSARYLNIDAVPWENWMDELVIEMPRIYPGSGQQKGDLNDLLDLAAVVGYCEGLHQGEEGAWGPRSRVFPAQWKGQVPKKIMTARILSKLSEIELGRIERVGAKDHNTLDAVGIGLWKLGRL